MAIKRVDPKAVVKIVSITDEAIDVEKSNLKAFSEDRDINHLIFREGQFPTIFHVGNVLAEKQAELKSKHYEIIPPSIDKDGKQVKAKVKVKDESLMMIEYFKAGVKKMEENGVLEDPNVEEIPFAVLEEIGSYVMLRATIGDKQKKTSK
jgi:hypothetical protein